MPELPEEAVEALALELAAETGQRTIKNGAGQYDTALLNRARSLLASAAPALRKQGAEEERARIAKRLAEVDHSTFSRAEIEEYMVYAERRVSEYAGWSADRERERVKALEDRDQALAKGAEEERERLREAMQAKIREAERRIAGETPKDRSLRLRELLGSDWPVVTLMRDAGGKSSPPWVWWMENNGYDADRYEVEHYIPLTALDTPAPSNRAEESDRG